MENELSIINESALEKSDSISFKDEKHTKEEFSNKTEDNYNFLKNFHSRYEKNEIKVNNPQTKIKKNKIIEINTSNTKSNLLKKKSSPEKEITPPSNPTLNNINSFLKQVSSPLKKPSALMQPLRKNSSPNAFPESPKTFRKGLIQNKPLQNRKYSLFMNSSNLIKKKIAQPSFSQSSKDLKGAFH